MKLVSGSPAAAHDLRADARRSASGEHTPFGLARPPPMHGGGGGGGVRGQHEYVNELLDPFPHFSSGEKLVMRSLPAAHAFSAATRRSVSGVHARHRSPRRRG